MIPSTKKSTRSIERAILACVAAILAGCSSSGDDANVVRFVFAPDAIVRYMHDTGIVERHEALYGKRIEFIETWDEAAFFAGGHADIASTGDYEVPSMMRESDDEFVIFGIYNLGRVPIWVKTDSPYRSIRDLRGKRFGVTGPLSSAMIWAVMLAETEGVNLTIGSDEFDMIVNSHFANSELLRNGQIEGGIIIAEALVPQMASGEIRLLYEGIGGTWEYYRDHFDPEQMHKGVPGNIFLARREWFDSHPEEVEFFLAMWEEALQAWRANQSEIIARYPEEFGLDPLSDNYDAELEAMTRYTIDHDWLPDTVYLDEEWVETESQVFDLMRRGGFMLEDAPNPTFVVVPPPDARPE
ncbi:MAG TPA: PhnD/SsuA/transferrin family substrate-binding protein [Gammaproteobacteria bacterium]